MQQWLAEGRVVGEAFVWRAGWEAWRTASEVFPQLSSPTGPVQGVVDPTVERGGSGTARSPLLERQLRLRQARRRTALLVTLLGLASMILLAILIAVVHYGWSPL